MALLEILKYPDPRLRRKAERVGEIDDRIRSLVADMIDTMYHARGIGLAATQVGVEKRVIVLDVPDDEEVYDEERGKNLIVLINPEVLSTEGSMRYKEGCLSFPGITVEVKRYSKVVVRGLDRDGKEITIQGEGLLAVALQHEIDHLDGILFIDRVSRLKRDMIKRKIKKTLAQERDSTTDRMA